MKKIILTLAGMMAVGIAVNAQSDSTYTSQSKTQSSSQTQDQRYPYKAADREVIESTDIPQSLRQTLRDSRYSGWENVTIYRDKATTDFYFELPKGTSTMQYRFDENGKAIQNGPTSTKSSSTPKTTNESYNGSTDGTRSGSTSSGSTTDGSVTGSNKHHKTTSYKKSSTKKSSSTK